MNDLPGYDSWLTREPPEPLCDNEDCTCTTHKRDKWCPVHGLDPDAERDRRIEDGDWA